MVNTQTYVFCKCQVGIGVVSVFSIVEGGVYKLGTKCTYIIFHTNIHNVINFSPWLSWCKGLFCDSKVCG